MSNDLICHVSSTLRFFGANCSIKCIRLLSVGELRFGNELVGIFCQFRSALFRLNFGSWKVQSATRIGLGAKKFLVAIISKSTLKIC